MITFKALVFEHHRKADGTYPVKIRVSFKGKSKYLPTTMAATPADLTRSLRIKSPDIINKTNELIGRMRDAVKGISPFALESRDVDWVVSHIKTEMTDESFSLDFFDFADAFLAEKPEVNRGVFVTALNHLERFLGQRKLDINSITKTMMQDYMRFVENSPKLYWDKKRGVLKETGKRKIEKGAASRNVNNLQHIFNEAKSRYNDEDDGRILIPRSPFDKLEKTFPASQGQPNLGIELMQRIISADTDNPKIRIALDAFVISFGLMGANMADLYNASPQTSVWTYNRAKTKKRRADKAKTIVNIPEVLKPYIERLQDGSNDWWLPILHSRGGNKNDCTRAINRALKKWCEQENVPAFTFYAARHSFASIGRSIGIEKATIDDCLIHKGDYSVTDIYAEKAWDIMQEANRQILALFKW